jgi:formylglycine-generating enzyme
MKYIIACFLLVFVSLLHAQETDIVRHVNRSSDNKLKFIPSITQSATDSTGRKVVRSTRSFYMSEYEVSNHEYRQFVNYVRDSIAHTVLSHFLPGEIKIDWKQAIRWDDKKLQALWVEENWNRSALNTDVVIYKMGTLEVPVYPDTLVWLTDFGYSYNEPLVKNYFSHDKYAAFPVVGIKYLQALAFCHWKTGELNSRIGSKINKYTVVASLPTVAEWEAATSGDDQTFMNLLFRNGKYNINSGQITEIDGFMVKDYADDGYYYASPVNNYLPNTFGLYNMIGNVWEWVLKNETDVFRLSEDLCTVKGGGWDSSASMLMPSFNRQLSPSSAHSFVGFRYVMRITSKD